MAWTATGVHRRWLVSAGAVVGLVVAVVTACAGSGGEAEQGREDRGRPTTTATVALTTTSVPDEEAAVLAAVEGFISSTISANDPPNPNHPDLARYRAGPLLDTAISEVAENARLGFVVRLPADSIYRSSASVTAIDGDRALVRNCIVDDAQLVSAQSGEVLNDRVVTKHFETELAHIEGTWRVTANVEVARWDGVVECAY